MCVCLCVCCVSFSLQTQTWLDSFSVYFPLSPESLSLCLSASLAALVSSQSRCTADYLMNIKMQRSGAALWAFFLFLLLLLPSGVMRIPFCWSGGTLPHVICSRAEYLTATVTTVVGLTVELSENRLHIACAGDLWWRAAGSGPPPPFVIGKNKVGASVIFAPLSAESHLGAKLFEITSLWQKQTFSLSSDLPPNEFSCRWGKTSPLI